MSTPTIVSPDLAETLKRIGPGRPVRVTAVAPAGAADDAAAEDLAGRPAWRVERRGPGVFDIELLIDDIDDLVATGRFARLEPGGRLFGRHVLEPDQHAEVAISLAPGMNQAALARLGLDGAKRSGDEVTGTVRGAALAGLVTADGVQSVEVRRVID